MMYQPSIPANNHLTLEKQYEIVETILSRYLWYYDTPDTSMLITKMLERTFRIGSILKIINK